MANNEVHYGSTELGLRLNRLGKVDKNTYSQKNNNNLVSAPDCITCKKVLLYTSTPQCKACITNQHKTNAIKSIKATSTSKTISSHRS